MTNTLKYKEDILFEALKMTIASIQLLLYKYNNITRENLVYYTNYYVAVSLKSFYKLLNTKKIYTSKDDEIKTFISFYTQYLKESEEDTKDLGQYLIFKTEYEKLDDDEKLIIYAMLALSKFYGTKHINKIKNILNSYSKKLKNCIKCASDYYIVFDTNKYDYYTAQRILFNFLIENS